MEALSHTYSANAVNQYILENIPGVVPITGEADPAAEVTAIQGEDSVNYPPQFGMKPERDGKYFFGFFRVDNTWEEAEHHYKVYAVKPDPANADRYLATKKEGSYTVPQALQPFTYDADGNTLTWRGWTYTWDAENRLKSVSKGDLLLEFTYDFSSRRVSKKVTRAEVVESHTTFIYDGYKLVEERDALNANALLRRYHWNLVMDTPATVYDAGQNTTYYYLTDANKNVLALQDASGNRVATYDYSPYGEQLEATGDYASLNPFRFSSEYFDNETGLVYYNYRYYNPATGRWLSREPLEEEGSLNLYSMVFNNPVKYWDLYGALTISEIVTRTGEGQIAVSLQEKELDSLPAERRREVNQRHCDYVIASTSTAASFVPGLGDAMDVYDFISATYRGDPTGQLLASAGLLPFVGGIIKPISEVGSTVVSGGRHLASQGANIAQAPARLAGNAVDGVTDAAQAGTRAASAAGDAGGAVSTTPKLYEVGTYKNLKQTDTVGDMLDNHHAIQRAQGELHISCFTRDNGAAIRLPYSEHTLVSAGQRGMSFASARDALAHDLWLLRKHTNAPNSALQELSDFNKILFPDAFKKR